MRKYTESMPSATDCRNLRFKIGLFFSLPLLPIIWILSIWALVETNSASSRSVPVVPINSIPATLVGVSQEAQGDYLDAEFFTGTRRNRVNLSVRRQDVEKYHRYQSVSIVRDASPDARYEYCLLDDYVSAHRQAKNMELAGLWLGAILPIMLAYWFWKKWSRPKSKTQDIYENNFPA